MSNNTPQQVAAMDVADEARRKCPGGRFEVSDGSNGSTIARCLPGEADDRRAEEKSARGASAGEASAAGVELQKSLALPGGSTDGGASPGSYCLDGKSTDGQLCRTAAARQLAELDLGHFHKGTSRDEWEFAARALPEVLTLLKRACELHADHACAELASAKKMADAFFKAMPPKFGF